MDKGTRQTAARQGIRNTRDVHVLWPDCDPAGILFYANYYRWMDDASYFLFVKAGLAWERLRADYGVPGVPLVSAHADFMTPAKFGEILTVESHVSQCGRSSFTVSHVFRLGDATAAEGWEKRVWCSVDPDDPAKIKAIPLPDEVKAALGVG